MVAVGGEELIFSFGESGVELGSGRICFKALPIVDGFVASGGEWFFREDSFSLSGGGDEERVCAFREGSFLFVEKRAGLIVCCDLEDAGVGDFDEIVGEFDPVLPVVIFVADCSEFVDAAEGGLFGGSDEICADAPDIDACSDGFEVTDFFFAEIVTGNDFGVVESGLVEDLTGADAEGGEVA